MNILIAMDSFKGSLNAKHVVESVKTGIQKANPSANIISMPIADGGEGTFETLLTALGGFKKTIPVHDPLHRKISATYGIINHTSAIMEMAEASGLPLLKTHERDPLKTSSYGTGEMIYDALERGIRSFVIGIGGSATNDGGTGMLSALGYRFFDEKGNVLSPHGGNLLSINHMDASEVHPGLKETSFTIACDVNNPLYGKDGATYVYGPQKGAHGNTLKILDNGLKHLASIIEAHTGIDPSHVEGSGAAGGLGAAFYAVLNATLRSGISIVFDALNVEGAIQTSDLVITGEGQIDKQTLMGKGPGGIISLANKHAKPVIALAAAITDDAYELNDNVDGLFTVANAAFTHDQMMHSTRAALMLEYTAYNLFKFRQ